MHLSCNPFQCTYGTLNKLGQGRIGVAFERPRQSLWLDDSCDTFVTLPVVSDLRFGVLSFGCLCRMAPSSHVLQMFRFAELSRFQVIPVTARKADRDFNTVFAK
jgi:hypothetical protein